MFAALAKSIFGSANDRYGRGLGKYVDAVSAIEAETQALTDDELKARTGIFRRRLADGARLDDLLPEAFATVREAAIRTLGQRHYDVQLIGGIALHRGEIAEVKTGGAKTLVATLAVYLNALEGKGVHVVTVNDYLARRDADWMGQIYRFLGMSVGVIVPNLSDQERRDAYACDITYATNNELGFDYLRDNMKYSRDQMVQRPFNFAIVDEVDSILIDEARTPLIISGPTDDKSDLYISVDGLVKTLVPADYDLDEKQKSVVLTEEGTEKSERMLEEAGLIEGRNLYDIANTQVVHHLNQALKANVMFKKDIDYIVKDRKVVIIDEFTGRMMEGRRWSDGLHQAVEAKEGVKHSVLNARFHEQEAHIVAQAGRLGMVTIATNMAGRGTDIQLGGNVDFRIQDELGETEDGPDKDKAIERIRQEVAEEKAKVLDAGGLYVLGTERHESRRIDNQLRGRSGRQGDPGLSKFYLSLDDDLLRIFGPQTMFSRLMNKNLEDGEAIVRPWISKAIETAQKKVEARNYDIRKQVVEFDDVMNDQRKVIYEQRADIMDAESVSETIIDMRAETAAALVAVSCPEGTYPEQWDVVGLKEAIDEVFGLQPPIDQWIEEEAVDPEMIAERLQKLADDAMASKLEQVERERWDEVEKQLLIQTLDHHWKEHLATLDALRQVIHLRSYAQKKPIDEYKQEAFLLFERLLVSIREEVTRVLMRAQVQLEAAPPPVLPDFITQHLDPFSGDDDTADIDAATGVVLSNLPPLSIPQPQLPHGQPGEVVEAPVSRNAPCPCGSGRKYKHCHGLLAYRAPPPPDRSIDPG